MRLGRLRQMSGAELAVRGRQQASKWIDRISRRRVAERVRAAGTLRDGYHARAHQIFFEGAVSDDVPALLCERFPGARTSILQAAESRLAGRFDLLGYRGLRFGDPIDWQLDPVSGRRAPLVHWSRVHTLDFAEVGDSKVVWELSRHQWLVTLAQAYRLTRDERYACAVSRHLWNWIRSNPRGLGIHWASSLECAFRIVSWTWVLCLLRGSHALSAGVFGEVLLSLEAHASHVERYLSTYFSPNTHLTGEAMGLVYAGLLFPDLPRAAQGLERGLAILSREGGRQILPDGVYFERAFCYQRYTAELYLHLLILARRSGLSLPGAVEERLQRLLDALLVLRRPDGGMPAVGDADGGWLLPLVPRAPDDVRGVFAIAAALFGRCDYAWAAGGPAPEVLWMLGPEGLAASDALAAAPPAKSPSRLLADGGIAVMASDWGGDAHQMTLDVGPLGCGVSGGHGHADLLSIQCSAFGEPYLVDPGTYVYTDASPRWRDFFRGSLAHATVSVDGLGQAETAGPFAWKARPSARLRRWLSTQDFDLADGEHDAYARLADPVVHRRRVVFVKPHYFVVVDDLHGSGRHRIEVRFPFAPLRVAVEAWPWVRAQGTRGRGLLLRSFASAPIEVEIHEGETNPIQGWVSPDYGRLERAPVVVQSVSGGLPLRILTLLLPLEDIAQAPPEVVALAADGVGPAGLVVDGRETVRFTDDHVSIERR